MSRRRPRASDRSLSVDRVSRNSSTKTPSKYDPLTDWTLKVLDLDNQLLEHEKLLLSRLITSLGIQISEKSKF